MVTDQSKSEQGSTPDPTWGDTVRVELGAPAVLRPGSLGEVVGIREVENSEQASQFSASVGSKIYLVEFGDGEAIELSQRWLHLFSST